MSQEPDADKSFNFYTIASLVMDLGADVFRNLLLKEVPPNIMSSQLQKILNSQFLMKLLTKDQIKLLQEPIPDPSKFDFSLVTILMKNICPNIKQPTKGWGAPPDPMDKSIGADIKRLLDIRNNKLLLHAPSTLMSNSEFVLLWNDSTVVILRLAAFVSQKLVDEAKAKIRELQHKQIDMSTANKLRLSTLLEDCIVTSLQHSEEQRDIACSLEKLNKKVDKLIDKDHCHQYDCLYDAIFLQRHFPHDPAGHKIQLSCPEDDHASDYSLKTVQQLTNKHYGDLINENMVEDFITNRGPRSKEVRLFLSWLCSGVEDMLISVERVWTGYDPRGILSPVFVAEVTTETQSTPKLLNRFNIIQRQKGYVSDEAEYVSNMEMRKGLEFTAKEQVAIQRCLTKHTDTLMKNHSNLLIVSAAKIKSKNHGNRGAVYEETTCIVFYVHIKGIIPFGEDAFPTWLEGFPVDIREGKFKTFSNANDYHERLKMGCQIVTAYNMICSLGGFIELETGNIGCLTCAHAFYTNESIADYQKNTETESFLKREVFQPQLAPDFEFGRMVKLMRAAGDSENIGVDAALIEITKPHRHPNSGDFPDATSRIAGFSGEKPMVFSTGKIIERLEEIPIPCTVVKYGASTGHTIGLLRLAGPAVRVYSSAFYPDDGIELNQQLEVFSIKDEVFADHGDSGSLVFLVTKSGSDMEVRALGLLVGGTTYGTTIVTPIWAVLNKLNLPLRLFSFENPIGLSGDPAHERLERIESDVDLLKQNTEETKQRIGSLENKIDDTDRKQEERSVSIQNKLEAQQSGIICIENKLEAQQSGIICIENILEAQHTDLSKKLDALLQIMASNK